MDGHRCALVRPHFPPSGSQAVLISCGGLGSGGVMSEQEMNEVIVGGGGEGAGWTWPVGEQAGVGSGPSDPCVATPDVKTQLSTLVD